MEDGNAENLDEKCEGKIKMWKIEGKYKYINIRRKLGRKIKKI